MGWNWITPRIALGSEPSASDIAAMRRQGITDVLDVRGEPRAGDEPHPELYAGTGIAYHYVPMLDRGIVAATPAEATAKYREDVQIIANALAKPDGKILVHCSAGMYRSPSVVYAYLRCTGLSPDAAWSKIISARSVAKRQYVPAAETAVPSLSCDAQTVNMGATGVIVGGIVIAGAVYLYKRLA